GQVAERGARKGFRTDLEDEAGGAALDHSQAHPVDRDAATDLDAVERGARLDLEPRKLRALLDRADRADFLDDAREHQALRGPRPAAAPPRRPPPRGVTVKPPRRPALLSPRPEPPTTGVAPRPPISSGAANMATRSTRPASRKAPWTSPPP